jgi:hypothetical protein
MPNDVSCPDPDAPVTRKILADELAKELAKFPTRDEMGAHLQTMEQRLRDHVSAELARHAGATEENVIRGVMVVLEAQSTKKQVDDHETRINQNRSTP